MSFSACEFIYCLWCSAFRIVFYTEQGSTPTNNLSASYACRNKEKDEEQGRVWDKAQNSMTSADVPIQQ